MNGYYEDEDSLIIIQILRTPVLKITCHNCQSEFLKTKDNDDLAKTIIDFINPEFIKNAETAIDRENKTVDLRKISINPYTTFSKFKLFSILVDKSIAPKIEVGRFHYDYQIHIGIECKTCKIEPEIYSATEFSEEERHIFNKLCEKHGNTFIKR